jgi:hypothetical protein
VSAKFVSAAFSVTLSRGFMLVAIVKNSVGDASPVSVFPHVLHNIHYVVSTHLKWIVIDISETRVINYARFYVVLWLITCLRKNNLHARLVLQLLTGDRQINLFTFLDAAKEPVYLL